MRLRSPLAALSLVLTAPLAAQDRDFSKVEVKAEKVAGSVYMLTGAGGNIAVSIGEDGVLVVDDQFAPLVPKIQAAIKGLSDKPVRWVLNTHWHPDHTGGNEELGRTSTLIAHDNVRKRLAEGSPSVAGNKVDPAPKGALPVITFDHSLTVHVNGEDIRALHWAKGHTDGDSIIYFPASNVVHMGDDFVTYGLPFVDVGSGGSVLGMVENVEKAMATLPACPSWTWEAGAACWAWWRTSRRRWPPCPTTSRSSPGTAPSPARRTRGSSRTCYGTASASYRGR